MNSTPTRAILPNQQLHAEATRVTSWRFGAMLPSGSKKLLLRPLTLAVSLTFGGMHAQTLAQSVVLTDGKTATTVNKQGPTLDVSTSTVSGSRAFNSFSRFEVAQGDVLNLRLPDGTNTLVNMVYDRPIRIDGILNSIQNNQIGGKVIFADPFGMVVGRTGVLNVGSLFVTTPTAQAMLGVIGANGQVNNLAAQDLIDGKLPQAAGSLIRIDGRINALERIRLQAEQVQVGQGAVVLASADARHEAAFVSAVNTQGLETATGMVDKGGVIEIIGKSLTLAGTLDASGAQGGGTVRLGRVGDERAEQVRVESTGKILANATQQGDGGTVDVWGTQGNVFLGVISAKGGTQSGNGGFAEVSAKQGLMFDGAVDMRAAQGKTGDLLIDPDTLCIDANAAATCGPNGSVVTFVSINSNLGTANQTYKADSTLYVGGSNGSSTSGTLTASSNTLTLIGNDVRFNSGSTLVTQGASVKLKTDTQTGLENNGSVQFGTNAQLRTNGGNIDVQAATVTVGAGSVLDTRKSAGTSGNINLTTRNVNPGIAVDPKITIDGAKLYADATGAGGKAGKITAEVYSPNNATLAVKAGSILSAVGSDGEVNLLANTSNPLNIFGVKTVSAAVTVDSATLSSGTITLKAETKIENQALVPTKFDADGKPVLDNTYWDRYQNNLGTGLLTGFTDLVIPNALATLGELAGVNFVLSRAASNTNVTVSGNSVLDASKKVSISAESSLEAGNGNNVIAKLIGAFVDDNKYKNQSFGIGAMYVGTYADTKVSLASGVTLKGADLEIGARNKAIVEGEIETPNTDNAANAGSKLALAVGFAHANLKSNVEVASGVNVRSTGDVQISAVNFASVKNTAATSTGESGVASLALALTLQNTQAKINMGSSINDALSVTMWAVDKQTDSVTTSKATAGATPLMRLQTNAGQLMTSEAPASLISAYKARAEAKENAANGQKDSSTQYKTDPVRFSGALAIAVEDHGAVTNLADGISIHARGETDGNGKNTGNEVFIGSWSGGDGPALRAASSSVSSTNSGGTTTGSGAKISPSAAAAVGDYNFNADTVVGNNVSITGGKLGLWSHVSENFRPNAADGSLSKDGAWSSFKKVTDNLGLLVSTAKMEFINNQVRAKGTGDEAGFAGAVSVIVNATQARTEIGAGSKLQQTDNADGKLSSGAWSKEFTVDTNAQNVKDNVTFAAPSAITAYSDTSTRFIAQAGELLSSSDSGSGVGVSDAVEIFSNKSNVIVREGVQISRVTETSAPDASGAKIYTVTGTSQASDVSLQSVNDNLLVSFAVGAGKSKDTNFTYMGVQNILDNAAQVRVDDEVKIQAKSLDVNAADTPTTYGLAGAFSLSASKAAGVAFGLNYIQTNTLAEIADNDKLATGGAASRSSQLTVASPSIAVGDLGAHAHTGGAQFAVGVAGSATDVSNTSSKLGQAISKTSNTINGFANKFNQWMGDAKVDQKSADDAKSKKDTQFKGWAFSGAGSIAVNVDDLNTKVNLDGVSGSVGNLEAVATGDSAIVSAAGSAAITMTGKNTTSSGSTNFAGAVAASVIGNKTEVALNNLSFTGIKDTKIMALKGGENLSIAIGMTLTKGAQDATPSNGFAGVASVTLDMPDDWDNLSGPSRNAARVSIKNTSLEGTDTGDLNVVAYNSSKIGTGGGTLNVNSKKSIGASISYADISNDTSVTIDGLNSSKFKSETLQAHSAAQIISAAVSSAVSVGQKDSTGLNGAVVVNYIGDTTTVTVKNSTLSSSNASVKATEGVVQSAYEGLLNTGSVVPNKDESGADNSYDYSGKTIFTDASMASGNTGSSIIAVAGSVQVGTGDGSSNYGASVGVNIINNTTSAKLDKVTNAKGGVAVQSSSDAYIRAVSAGVSVSSSKSIAGSVAVNLITNSVESETKDSAMRGTQTSARDGANIDAIAGQVTVSTGKNGAAIGGALSVNVIADKAKSTLTGNTITGGLSGSGSQVSSDASSTGRIRAIDAAGSLAADASSTTFSGSMGLSVIANTVDASIGTTTLSSMSGSADLLRASATDSATIQTLSGSVSLGMGASYGGALSVNTITGSANAKLNAVSASGVEQTQTQISTTGAIDAIAAGVAASNEKMAIAGSATANTITHAGEAAISGSNIAGGTLNLSSSDTSTIQTIAGSAAVSLGSNAIGAAASVNTITGTHSATISGSTLNLTGALTATNTEAATIRALAASGAASKEVSVTGSLANNVITNSSTIGFSNDSLSSNGLSALAKDESKIETLSGAVAISADKTAVGAALSVNTIVNTVGVQADQSTITAGSGAYSEEAQSNTSIKAIAVSAAVTAGSSPSVAAVGANNVTTNTTYAKSIGSSLTGTGVKVKASDTSTIQGINGAASFSGGSAAVGGALANNVITNSVSALVDDKVVGVTTYASSVNAGSGKFEVAASNSSKIESLAAGLAGTSGVAVAGSATVNTIVNSTMALVDDTTGGGGSASVSASDTATIRTLAGSVALAGGSAAVGAAGAINTTANTVSAKVMDSTLNFTGGAASISASGNETIESLAAAGSASSDVAVSASFTTNTIVNTVSARLDNSTLKAVGANVTATDSATIRTLAGSAALGGQVAVGAAAAINTITGTTEAQITSSTLNAGSGALTHSAQKSGSIKSLAAAGSASTGAAAVAGSAATNTIVDKTRALSTNSTLQAGSLANTSKDNSEIQTLSGAVAVSAGVAGVGFAASINTITNENFAGGSGNTIAVGNAFSSQALSEEKIDSVAVAMSAAGGAAVSASAATNTVVNNTKATYTNTSTTANSVDVKASDSVAFRNFTGAAAIDFGGGAGVGGAASINTITNTTEADINGGTWSAGVGAFNVQALNSESIKAIAASAAVSATAGVAGSLSTDIITNTTKARVRNMTLTAASGGAKAYAEDSSYIGTIAGAAAVGASGAGVGAAITLNTIVNTINADVDAITVINAGGFNASTKSASSIDSLAAAGAGSGSVAVGGSSATNTIVMNNAATIDDSTINAGSVTVSGQDSSKIRTLSGSIALSGGVSVGGALAINTISNTNTAHIGKGSITAANGVNVSSTNNESIEALSAGAAGSTGVSVSGSLSVNTITNSTVAEIDAGSVNAGTTGDVKINATDSASIKSIAGAIAIGGGTSVGISAASNIIVNNVDARLRGGNSATVSVRDLVVSSGSTGAIKSIAAGIAGDGTVGVAGSVAVNVIANNTRSAVDKSADVTADNNAVVSAESTNDIAAIVGSAGIGIAAAGVGAASAVSVITGETSAIVGGNDVSGATKLDALAKGSAATITNGELVTQPTLSLSRPDQAYSTAALSTGTQASDGVAVTALSRRRISQGSATAGVGGVAGVAVTLNASAISASTLATIRDAQINQRGTADAGQDVNVIAASHTFGDGFTGSVAFGLTGAGVGAAFQGNGFGVDTRARILNSTVSARDDVLAKARATETQRAMSVGGGGGLVGVQGSGAVNVMRGTTEAAVYGGTITAADLDVQAKHDARMSAMAGAVAGGVVGAAVSFDIGVNNHTTIARVGASLEAGSAETASTMVASGTNVNVDAKSHTEIHMVSAVGAGGVGAGAFAVGVAVLDDTAKAYINKTTIAGAGSVSVKALVDANTLQQGGSVAFGGDAVGASVGVALARGVADAFISSSTVTTDALTLDALNKQVMDTMSISGAVAAGAGVAGSVQVSMIGFGAPSSEANTILGPNGAFTKAGAYANSDHLGADSSLDNTNSSDTKFTAANRNSVNGSTKYDFSSRLAAGSANISRARVMDSTLTVGNQANVTAASETALRNTVGGIGAGIGVGAAAGVSVARVYNDVEASIDTASNINSRYASRADLNVKAEARDLAGSWGLIGTSTSMKGVSGVSDTHRSIVNRSAVGAASIGLSGAITIADSEVNNAVKATVKPVSMALDDISITANDTSTLHSGAYGASVGGLAGGAAVSNARRSGSVRTELEPTAANGNALDELTMSSSSSGLVDAVVIAGTLGLAGAVSANVAMTSDSQSVVSRIGSGAHFDASGAVSVTATRQPKLHTSVTGVSISGGLQAGASVVTSTISGDTTAEILGGDDYNGSATVRARNLTPNSGRNIDADALAAGGGLLVGANGAVTTVTDSSGVSARWADDHLALGEMRVEALRDTRQRADASAVSVGFIGAGAVFATSNSSGNTSALLEGNAAAASTRNTNITVSANASVDSMADATAGTGGVIAGSAAIAKNNMSGTTTARLAATDNSAVIRANDVLVTAQRINKFNTHVSTVNASLVGASGANISNTIDTTAVAEVGANTTVKFNNFTLYALGKAEKGWWTGAENGTPNIESASGGLIDAPGATSLTDYRQSTSAKVNNGARLEVDFVEGSGSNLGGNNSVIRIDAGSDITLRDKVVMNSGGAIPIASGVSKQEVKRDDNSVLIGNGAQINATLGTVKVGSSAKVDLDARVNVDTYGLAGAPDGVAWAKYTGSNTVTVDVNSLVKGDTGVALASGLSSNGVLNQFNINSDVHTWNKTAIPIAGGPDAVSSLTSNNTLLIKANAIIESGTDIDMMALSGSDDINVYFGRNALSSVKSVGIGKDVYRETAAAVVSAVSNAFGGDDVSFDIKKSTVTRSTSGVVQMDGIARVGLNRSEKLTINEVVTADGTFVEYDQDGLNPITKQKYNVTYTVAEKTNGIGTILVNPGQEVGRETWNRILWLQKKEIDYAGTAEAAAYAAERKFLESRLVTQGLASRGADGKIDFGRGSTDGLSPRQIAQDQINEMSGQVAGVQITVTNKLTLKTEAETIHTKLQTIESGVTTIRTEQGNLVTLNTTLTTKQAALTTATTNQTNAVNAYNAAVTDQSSKQTAYNTANTACGSCTSGALFTDKVNAQNALNTANATLTTTTNTKNSAASAYGTAQSETSTAQTDVTNKQTAINGLITTYNTNKADAALPAAYLQPLTLTDYNSVVSAADVTAFDTKEKSYSTDIVAPRTTDYTNWNTSYTTLNKNITDLTNNLSTLSATPVAGVTVTQLIIPNISVKLGDIRIQANQLTGAATGSLSAPGDAQVTITNNSSSPIKLNDISVSSKGGEIRLNGFLVDNNADINKINDVDGAASGAGFGAVNTRRSGNNLATITIKSTYNPDNETRVEARRPAPDIVLASGSTIFNPEGMVSISSEAGSILSQGNIRAGVVDINAKNGDFVQGYVNGFFHVGADPQARKENSTNITPMGIVANGAIMLSARYLNINGTVQSGIADWNLTLGDPSTTQATGDASFFGLNSSAVLNFRADYLNSRGSGTIPASGRGSRFTTFAGTGGLTVNYDADTDELTAGYSATAAAISSPTGMYRLKGNGNIGVSYDRTNDRFVVDGTAVKGGYIKLFGQILNTEGANTLNNGGTTPSGLKVMDGFGNINITNNTGKKVVLGNIDAGTGAAGLIEISDIRSVDSNQVPSILNTSFTRNESGQIMWKQWWGTGDGPASFSVFNTATNNRSTSYAPQTGMRYQYTTGTDESTIREYQRVTRSFFNSDSLTVDQWYAGELIRGPFIQNRYNIPDGQRLILGSALTDYYNATSTTLSNGPASMAILRRWSECDPWFCITSRKYTQYRVTTPTKTVTYNTIKGDYDIPINFIGSDSGTISVLSNSDVLLQGGLRNINGATTLNATAGNIAQLNNLASITTKSVVLNASGSVGAETTGGAIRVTSVSDRNHMSRGTPDIIISGSANNGDFSVRQFSTNSILGDISASGKVSIFAKGNILSEGASKAVTAQRVELSSAEGSVGSIAADAPINIKIKSTTDPALYSSHGVKVNAYSDVNLYSQGWASNSSGDMLVESVVSNLGNVRLKADGKILDGNPVEGIDPRTWNELLGYWDSVQLRGTASIEKQDKMVKAFQNRVNRDYQTYWSIRGENAYDSGFNYTLTNDERNAFLNAGMTAAQITQYQTDKTTEYHSLNTRLSNLGVVGSAYNAGFSYVAAVTSTNLDGSKVYSNTEITSMLKGSKWSDKELGIALTPGLLKTATNTNATVKDPNVRSNGRIELFAGQGSGRSLSTLSIDLSQAPSTLTNEQKVALAAAERSDLSISGSTVTVNQIKPLNVFGTTLLAQGLASGTASNGAINIASRGSLALDSVMTTGEARIKVLGSLTNGRADGKSNVSANVGILEAAEGAIGGSTTPVRVESVGANSYYIARSKDGIWVNAPEGDLNVDTFYSVGKIDLSSTKGSINAAFADAGLDIRGKSIDLAAALNIGSSSKYLDVGVDTTGLINAKATGGSIYLRGAEGANFNLGNLTAGGDISLDADTLSGVINGNIIANGSVSIVGGDDLTIKGTAKVTAKTGNLIVAVEDLVVDPGAVLTAGKVASFDAETIAFNGTLNTGSGQTRLNATLGDLTMGANALIIGTGTGNFDAFGKNITMAETAKIQQNGYVRMNANGSGASQGVLSVSQVIGGNIDVNANAGVVGVGASNTHLRSTAIGGQVRVNTNNIAAAGVTKGTGVGTASQALRVATGRGYATTATGDVFLRILDSGDWSTISTGNGAVTVVAEKGFTAQRVAGMGSLNLSATATPTGNAISVLDAVSTNGGLTATAPGSLYFNNIQTAKAITLQAGTALTVGKATTLEDLVARSGAAMQISQGQAKSISLSAATGALTSTSLNAQIGTLTATATAGALTVGTAQAKQAVSLQGTSVTNNSATSGSNQDVFLNATGGNISYGQVNASKDARLTARDTISSQAGSLILAQSDVSLQAASVSGGNITANGANLGGKVSITGTSALASAGNVSGSQITVSAGTNAALVSANTSGALNLSAGGTANVANIINAASAKLTSIGNASIQAGNVAGTLELLSSNGAATVGSTGKTVNAAGVFAQGATVNAAGIVNSSNGMTLTASSGAVSAAAPAQLNITSGQLLINAATNATVANAQTTAGHITINSGSGQVLGTIQAGSAAGVGGDVLLTATAGGLNFSQLTAGRDLSVTVRDAVTRSSTLVGNVSATGVVNMKGLGLTLGNVQAGGALSLTSTGQALSAGNVISNTGAVVIKSASNVTLSQLQTLVGGATVEAVRDATISQLHVAGFFGLKVGRNATLGTAAGSCTGASGFNTNNFYVGNGLNFDVSFGTLTLNGCRQINGSQTIAALTRVGI